VLYATFAGPWSDGPAGGEPQFQLPQCYYMQPPSLKTTHFSKFTLESLFYIFYAMPSDILQVRDSLYCALPILRALL
jgi:CCR4-NOT transcription complex subunit 2